MAHLLLIDDDDLFRPMFREKLEQMGHTVTEALNGKEGLACYESAPFDLVLADLLMPEKEGLETITEMKKRWPEVKIIAISGGGLMAASSYLRMAQQLGVECTLAKPFSNDELTAAINKMLPPKGP